MEQASPNQDRSALFHPRSANLRFQAFADRSLNPTEHLTVSSSTSPIQQIAAFFALYTFWSTQITVGSFETIYQEVDIREFSLSLLVFMRGGRR